MNETQIAFNIRQKKKEKKSHDNVMSNAMNNDGMVKGAGFR